MDKKSWVANHDGNLSQKIGTDEFLVTPTARAKGDLKSSDLIEIDFSGKTAKGTGKVFSEWAIHQLVFDHRGDVQAVVHAHPPHATAVGCAEQEMMTHAIPEAVVSIGPGVPVVGLGLPGSPEVMDELEQLIPHYDAVCVAGNGVFSWGKDLEQAFLRLELVEHLASIFLKSMPLGSPKMLNPDQVRELLKKREKAGLARPADPNRPHWYGNV